MNLKNNKFGILLIIFIIFIFNIIAVSAAIYIPKNNNKTENIKKSGIIMNTNKVSKILKSKLYVKDVEDNTVINNFEEYISIINKAMETLQPEIKLIINNFNEKDYKLNELSLNGIDRIKYTGSILDSKASIVVTISYSQGFKVQQATKNNLALNRLSSEDKMVMDKANEILKKIIKKEMTDYEKELAIHDYLVLNCEYDYNNINDKIPRASYTIYGLLINGKGVCQAYSEAAKLLLNMVGIECDIVTGTANSEAHAWNIVKLDNEYYMLDITWDDPYPDEKGRVIYNYFNVTSDKLALDHNWNKNKWNTANGTKYNYYEYNNMIVNSYEEFKEFVINKIKQGEKEIFLYINGYNKNEYSMDFIFNYYNGIVNYSMPNEINTPYHITLR